MTNFHKKVILQFLQIKQKIRNRLNDESMQRCSRILLIISNIVAREHSD